MKKIFLVFVLTVIAFAGLTQTPKVKTTKSPTTTKPKKTLSEMTAIEVAKNPEAYGFERGESIVTAPPQGSDLEPSRDAQWKKKTSDGKQYILTIDYFHGFSQLLLPHRQSI